MISRKTKPLFTKVAVVIVLVTAIGSAVLLSGLKSNTKASGLSPRFVATEDVSVSSSSLRDTTSLFVEKNQKKTTRTFLKFQVSGITSPITSAKVLLHSTRNSKQGGQIAQVSATSWSEATMTWANQPAIDGPTLASVDAVVSGDYYEWDVTPAITGDGTYSFALTCTACTARYNSSEASSKVPYLVVTYASTDPVPTSNPDDPALVGAGDIASCTSAGDEKTATLLDAITGTIFTAGDNAYPNGTDEDFTNCFNPTWGRHKTRIKPAAGNHEYNTPAATGYFSYFGAAAGDPAKGYYSYDLGKWHIVVLNSQCAQVGGCAAGTPQEQWLRADLTANPKLCTLAYMHFPRFSSGQSHGSQSAMQPLWQALYDNNADVVVAAHDHSYERFTPQDPTGVTDYARGIREFVAGTGGVNHYTFKTPIANSEVRNNDTFGVLKFSLHPTSYEWNFVPEAGKTFTDSGSDTCH